MYSKNFLVAIVQALLMLPLLSQAQNQEYRSGFISIDCGISGISKYTDSSTNITYYEDTDFTEYGENGNISPESAKLIGDSAQLKNVRSFPQGTRNCYTLKPSQGKGYKYIVRARFMYGNYDNKLQAPTFDLYIGPNLWATVMAWNSQTQIVQEIIYVPLSDQIYVCLVNTGHGIPFISSLELRPISGNEIYLTEPGKSLLLYGRADFSAQPTQVLTRYMDDIYDRLWTPVMGAVTLKTDKLSDMSSFHGGDFKVPFTVMSTAATNNRSGNFVSIDFTDMNETSTYIFCMHFAEVEEIETNQTRQFNIYMDENLWFGPVEPRYLWTNTVRSGSRGTKVNSQGKLKIWINNTNIATLPPLINAMEVFVLLDLPLLDTNQTDVEAVMNIKSAYGLKRIEWQGDPCYPEAYMWNGVNCSYKDNDAPRISSLNLSSSSLTGEISMFIANLTMLEYLDLSNNQLSGEVPEFLGQLSLLKILNLKGNNFTGQIPQALLSKKDLELSLDTNLVNNNDTPCSSGSCGKMKSAVVPLVAAFSAVFLVALVTMVVIWGLKRRRQQNITNVRVETASIEPRVVAHPREEDEVFGSKKQQFTYSDIQTITNNFHRVLGEGGFGKVYHGCLNGNQVAVKMLTSPSASGHRQFHTELILLLRVHHKNLTSLVGYCNEGANIGLIYEYMAMGNLRSHLTGARQRILSWEERLRIAIDTTQGLEYLHNGCKPPIIHRDVKSTNILLNEKFQAKLGDFGISKTFLLEGENDTTANGTPGIATSIAGTPGYLDPEYYKTNWLNEKSDVYSFGVVLLEIITCRPVFTKTREQNHIIDWVSVNLGKGDIRNILDSRLEGRICDINTVWKSIEIAIACVSKTDINRPTMSQVTTELKECLMTELSRKEADRSEDASVEIISGLLVSEFSPLAR